MNITAKRIKPQQTVLQQKGFTLLEFFIAITLGLILLAGILEIFLHAQSSYNLSTSMSQLQENSRFIDMYVSRIVRLAAYRSDPTTSNAFTPISTLYTTTTPYISGTYATGPNGSDTLTIRYQGSGNGTGTPDGTIVDCLNVPVDANTMVTNTFSLTTNNELQCQSINPSSATPNNTQVLISGVENFHVLFGEDLTGNFSASRYVPANYAYINLADVVSVRLSFLMRSLAPSNPFASQNTFYLAGTTYTPAAPDEYLRVPITLTIVLRNLITNTS